MADPRGRPPWAAPLAEGSAWMLLVTGSYLTFVGPVDLLEVGVGLAVAAVCAVLAVLVRRAAHLPYRPVPHVARWLLPLPLAVLTDTAVLLAALTRRLAGRPGAGGGFAEESLPDQPRDRAPTARAVAMLARSTPPGTYVVGVSDDGRTLHVHRLMAHGGKVAR